MIKVDVRGSLNGIIADLERSRRDVLDKAIPRALNKVAEQAKTAAAREIRAAGYKLKVSEIKKGLSITRASSGQLVAKVIANGRPVPLIRYGARQVGSGVSVDVLHGRKVITGAFIATMPSGHKGVFVRVGRTHKKVSKNGHSVWSGLPIKELFGPTVPNGLANAAVQGALQRFIQDKFPEILLQQIKYLSR